MAFVASVEIRWYNGSRTELWIVLNTKRGKTIEGEVVFPMHNLNGGRKRSRNVRGLLLLLLNLREWTDARPGQGVRVETSAP